MLEQRERIRLKKRLIELQQRDVEQLQEILSLQDASGDVSNALKTVLGVNGPYRLSPPLLATARSVKEDEPEKPSKYKNHHVLLLVSGAIEKGLTRKEVAKLKKQGGLPPGAIIFDSEMEARFYRDQLKPYVGSRIMMIQMQPRYELIPSFVNSKGTRHRAHSYSPDFLVCYADGSESAFDVKGYENDRFPINRKLFEYQHPEIPLVVMKFVKKFGGWITDETYRQEKRKSNKDLITAMKRGAAAK